MEAVGEHGKSDVQLVYADNCTPLDKPSLYEHLDNLACVAMDPLHVALKVEKATDGKKNAVSSLLRRCLTKFTMGQDDGRPYFKSGAAAPAVTSLSDSMEDMTTSTAARRIRRIRKDEYLLSPYLREIDFVRNVAAILLSYPEYLRKRTGNTSTVLSSLAFFTSKGELQYLFNGCRWISRNPEAKVPYGTTGCEAVHHEIKTFFSSSNQKTARFARTMTKLFNLRKLNVGVLQRLPLSKCLRQRALMTRGVNALNVMPFQWGRHLEIQSRQRDIVDTSQLPKNALVSLRVRRRKNLS